MATDDPLQSLPPGRLTAYEFMRRHYRRLSALFEGTIIDWEAMRQPFADMGVRTADGKPLKSEGLRGAWYRVRRDMRRQDKPKPNIRQGGTITVQQHDQQPDDGSDDPLRAVKEEMQRRSGR